MYKALYFDMDGTVYGFYQVLNWLGLLRKEDITPYVIGKPCINLDELSKVAADFIALGWTIGIITWTAQGGSKEYNKAVRKAKLAWVRKYMPYVSEFHCVKYGTPKHKVAKIKNSVLVDDNAEVRKAWTNGETINASNCEETVELLKKLLQAAIKFDTM